MHNPRHSLLLLLSLILFSSMPYADTCDINKTLNKNEWTQIGLPCEPPSEANSVTDIFADDLTGTYGSDWIVYSFDTETNSYEDIGLSGKMSTGKGYWIISTQASATLDLPNNSTEMSLVASPQCAVNNCFELTLTASGGTQLQMIANPLPNDFSWSNLRIASDNGLGTCGDNNGCSMAEAETANLVYNQGWVYNAGTKTYDTIKNTTVAPWTGAWLATLPGATSANAPKLLTPASSSQGFQGLVWGKDTTPLSSDWIKPDLNQPYIDPAYGTTIRRVTKTNDERFNRNKYSRVQSENADGSHFFTYYGNARYHVYERDTLALVRELNIHPDSELQWHPSNPKKIRHLNGANTEQDSLTLYETDVTTSQTTIIADLTDQIRAIFPTATKMYDSDEGSPSKDGNRYAWMIDDINGNLLGFVTYDLSTNTVLGSLGNIPENIGEVDWVSVSPSGEYMIASSADKYNRDVVTSEGTYVFKVDFSDYTDFTNANLIFNAAEHSDIGIAKDGNDMYIYINFDSSSEDAGWIMGYNIKTKVYSHLVNIWADGANTSMHISAKGFNKPGWAVISTYGGIEGAWTYRKVYALELVDNGRIANLAHTYNCADTYFQETHAVVNRDFSRIYFNSTSNQCGYTEDEFHTEVYSIDVPAF